ncbi:MAG: sensor histidine kinase [Halobacteriaceae archaeon]
MGGFEPPSYDEFPRRLVAPFAIGGLGAVTVLVHLVHLFTELDELTPLLLGVVPPMLLSVTLVGGGYRLWRSDIDEAYHARILAWTGGGSIVVGGVGLSAILYQTAHGVTQADVAFMAGNWVTTGALAGFLVGTYDAERRSAFESLRRKHDELAARERELQRENERLDRFAGILSHDLRNPLNVAQGHLGLIENSSGSEHLDAIADALDRMEAIVGDVVTMMRDGEPVTEADLEWVALGECAASCWEFVDTADAKLRIEGSATVRADRSRLCEVFENLFRNAVEHGGEGVTVTVGAVSDGFYVADDGPGVPREERDDVFEAGYSTSSGESGYGLHVVREIAEAHGWDVRVTDGERGGARFETTGVALDDR